MTFQIPEHVLFNYVLENRGLNITADEWRDFLVTSGYKEILFTIDGSGLGFGTITRLDAGWPLTPLPPRPRPSWGIPNRTMITSFQKCAAKLGTKFPFFHGGARDHDITNYRQACNIEYFEHPDWMCRTRLGFPVIESTEEIFDAFVWICGRDGLGFGFGPRGIIRKTKVDGDEPPAKKRKRDIVQDICQNMQWKSCSAPVL